MCWSAKVPWRPSNLAVCQGVLNFKRLYGVSALLRQTPASRPLTILMILPVENQRCEVKLSVKSVSAASDRPKHRSLAANRQKGYDRAPSSVLVVNRRAIFYCDCASRPLSKLTGTTISGSLGLPRQVPEIGGWWLAAGKMIHGSDGFANLIGID